MIIEDHIQALIFDCDGTLVDSGAIHLQAWQKAIEYFGGPYDVDFLIWRNGLPLAQIIREYEQVFNIQIDLARFEQIKNYWVQQSISMVKPITPISDILHQHHQHYKTAVFSGGNRLDVSQSLRVNGLYDKCDIVITADDVHPPKNQPEAYVALAQRLGVAVEHCHFFEDGYYAISAARQAGMQVTDVRSIIDSAAVIS